jgi:hypothetical protein
MKRYLLTIVLTLFVALTVPAVNSNDISFVSYEQGWLDSKGTLALKNNTTEEIYNVKFLITYLDMSGKELDYEEYERRITIAPGMTKKLDIPAYEHSRSYHYYKSENMPGGSPSFKIKFELKDYNMVQSGANEDDDYSVLDDYNYKDKDYGSEYSATYMIIAIIAVLFFIGISVGLYVLVAIMAQKRHRSVVLWVLLSIIASPLLIIIILLVVGNDNKYIDNFDNTHH